jgi:hypothetical protein
LPFKKVMQAGPFDRADMDENVGAAGVRLNEPEALQCIESFHCAHGHGAVQRRTSRFEHDRLSAQ